MAPCSVQCGDASLVKSTWIGMCAIAMKRLTRGSGPVTMGMWGGATSSIGPG